MDTVIAAARRRQALAKKIRHGAVMLTAAAQPPRSRDTLYAPYRQNSYFYYLTGCDEPHTALIFTVRDGVIEQEIFFCRARDADAERWEGRRLTPAAAKRRLGIADSADVATLPGALADLAAPHDALYYAPGADSELDRLVMRLISERRGGNRLAKRFPGMFIDVTVLLDAMRLIKDETEIALLRRACEVTAEGVMAGMHAAVSAGHENQVEAAIIAAYRRAGGEHAFPPIVAGGGNACVLHYAANNARLQKNKALLIDTGCELGGYAGDITRTFPVNNDWSGAFADVYHIVLTAQQKALRAAKPGASLQSLEKIAERALAAGLRDLKLCRGSVDSILRRGRHRRFYMHRIGHWLGLDVHDVGAVKTPDGKPLRLRPGMTLTVEPGLYLPAAEDIPAPLAGIGIRIEDDILITANGNEILTAAAPKTPAAIRAWLRQA